MTMPATRRITKSKRRNPVNFVQVACWLSHDQRDALRRVQIKTRLTQQVLLREGVDAILERYQVAQR